MKSIFLSVLSLAILFIFSQGTASAAGSAERGGALQAFNSSGRILMAEVEENDNAVVYRSEPDKSQSELQEEERYKQEKSWEMLNNMMIVPRQIERPVRPPSGNPRSN